MHRAEPMTSATLTQGKSCAVRPEGSPAPGRARWERRAGDQAPGGLDAPALRYAVESLQHWLDLNA